MQETSLRSRAGRPRHKQRAILDCLRSRIAAAVWRPGQRLPTRAELCREFGSSLATLQAAINTLQGEGLIVADGSRGTFVAERRPQPLCFGLVISSSPLVQRPWSRLYMALEHEARVLEMEGAVRFPRYYIPHGRSAEPDFARLLKDLDDGRVAGLFFANAPFEYLGTPILDRPGVPRAAFASEAHRWGMPSVYTDGAALARRAVRFFHTRGRRRPALLSQRLLPAFAEAWADEIARSGMEAPGPSRHRTAHYRDPSAVRAAAQELLELAPAERPDCLLVSDDNLVEAAGEGLIAAGARVPDDLDVAVMWNFVAPPPCSAPAYRLGFDYRQVLSVAVDLLRRQMAGEQVIEDLRVAPLEEREWRALAPCAV